MRTASRLSQFFRPSVLVTGSRDLLQARWAHRTVETAPIPPPIPLVPDVETFLTVIGRGLREHAPKIPTWEALFTLTSDQLRELGVEPARSRRYLLNWRQKFREGRFGPGGDFKHVKNGVAHLKVYEHLINHVVKRRLPINVPAGKQADDLAREERKRCRPLQYKVQGVKTIVGPYALPLQGGGAQVKVTEGMWEDRRGRKIDGGERRRAEVRFKRGVALRKELREKQGIY